jgi:molecular chaperone HscB
MDPMFLMEQMELREALDAAPAAADPFAALDKVRSAAEATERTLVEELAALFLRDDAAALEQAPERLRKLQFMRKLLDEVDEREDDLAHGS